MKKEVDYTRKYPLLPLRDVVMYPHMTIPLFVGRDKSITALDAAMSSNRLVMLVTQIDSQIISPERDKLYDVGVIAEILQMLKLPDGTIKVLVEGLSRAYITDYFEDANICEVNVAAVERPAALSGKDLLALRSKVSDCFDRYVNFNRKIPRDTFIAVNEIESFSQFVDFVASHIDMRLDLKQTILNIGEPVERAEKLIELIGGAIEVFNLDRKIHGQVRKQMDRTQKEYYLNEQLKIIKKELNNGDEDLDDVASLKKSVEDAKMSKEATTKAMHEIKRLEKMPPMSAESTVARTYIEWLRDVPWHKKTKDRKDIDKALDILNEDHYGLEDVKERIIEHIAVSQLSKKLKGPILCFVGPPGVGKTSLGKSVARALGRKFVRVSLGGVRDEAEIRGHRRTYVGALPGRIIHMMKKAGVTNPVALFDEIDKMSMDFRGDPAAALLEVLDPEQNNSFVDHYMDVPYDLSDVMFITTANAQHNIPAPLLDRMEIIEISSYTEPEKLSIALQFLLKKQIEENGLKSNNINFDENSMLFLIRHYTKEAGVRNLERAIARVCRKTAREVVKNGSEFQKVITPDVIKEYLGPIKFKHGVKENVNEIALANGLAWTEVGGEILNIEASFVPGEGKLTITGQLGDVMQESAQAAFSYVRSQLPFFNANNDILSKQDVHLHVPEGAIPKDGPSAGITMAVVLASLVSKIPVRCDVAMTGEITLHGKVLPIGGLKEKVLAAHRAEITHVIIPKENEKDLEKIPEDVKAQMIFHPVSSMAEVLFLALESPEKFFKDVQKVRTLYDQWSEALGDWTVDMEHREAEVPGTSPI